MGSLGSGELEFDEFCDLAARFIGDEEEAEDAGAMQEDLREAFRLYDYEGEVIFCNRVG